MKRIMNVRALSAVGLTICIFMIGWLLLRSNLASDWSGFKSTLIMIFVFFGVLFFLIAHLNNK